VIRAVQTSRLGVPIPGKEREFSETFWKKMKAQWGSKLRWKEV